MNPTLVQSVFALVLLVMLGALTDPFMYWMPTMPEMTVLLISTALLLGWMGFVAREKAVDEREAEHRMFAGRVAYLSGLALLTIALVMQGFAHTIDPWVPIALAGMVVSKLAARWYADTFR
jgi:hypothetical protein